MALDMIGVGPHGYDFMVGHWECAASPVWVSNQPVALEMKFQRVKDGSLLQITSSYNFGVESETYKYISETKNWSTSDTNDQGDIIFSETTQVTGQKTVWTGWALDAGGSATVDPTPRIRAHNQEMYKQSGGNPRKIHVRDTWTFPSLDEFSDSVEQQTGAGDSWKLIESATCRRS